MLNKRKISNRERRKNFQRQEMNRRRELGMRKITRSEEVEDSKMGKVLELKRTDFFSFDLPPIEPVLFLGWPPEGFEPTVEVKFSSEIISEDKNSVEMAISQMPNDEGLASALPPDPADPETLRRIAESRRRTIIEGAIRREWNSPKSSGEIILPRYSLDGETPSWIEQELGG